MDFDVAVDWLSWVQTHWSGVRVNTIIQHGDSIDNTIGPVDHTKVLEKNDYSTCSNARIGLAVFFVFHPRKERQYWVYLGFADRKLASSRRNLGTVQRVEHVAEACSISVGSFGWPRTEKLWHFNF